MVRFTSSSSSSSWLRLLVVVASVVLVVVNAGTNDEGLAFLEANKEKEGVITLPSGLQYKVLREGTGTSHPTVDSPCSCHYEGTLIDGTKFDSSYDRGSPTTFAPNQVIKGWTEAMQLMVEGDKWEMYIPSELGYGDSGSGAKIPGGSVLVFTMEILEIQGNKVDALKCTVTDGTGSEDCNEKEMKYIEKLSSWDTSKITTEYERLMKMKGKDMKDELKEWINRRAHILKQLQKSNEEEEL